MRNLLFTIALSILPMCLSAQEDNHFAQANELYANNEYAAAANLYEEILANEGVSAELYYNLGNAYYKTKEIGLAILNYERALRLRPFYQDAKYNLQLARTQVMDKEEKPQMFFITSWLDSLMNQLREDTWAWISIAFFIVTLGFFFIFAFGKSLGVRKTGFRLAILFFIFTFTTFIFSATIHQKIKDKADAIVMTGTVTIKSSPDESGTDLFILHEGSKVLIKETLGEWSEIQFGNNTHIGWLKTAHLEKI